MNDPKYDNLPQFENDRIHTTVTAAILNSIASHIVVLDGEGKIIAVNEAWSQFAKENSATPGNEVTGTSMGSNYLETLRAVVGPPSDIEDARQTLAGIKAIIDRKIPTFYYEYPCHSNSIQRWFHLSVTPLKMAFGGAVVSHTEITERKRAELALQSSMKELSHLKQAIDRHSIVATTNRLGTITSVNDNFCTISRYSRDELIGQDHRIVNSGFHTKEFMGDLWKTILQGKLWQGEVQNKAKDGTPYWVATTIMPLQIENEEAKEFLAIRTDITERKVQEMEFQFVLDSLGIGVWKWNLKTNALSWDRNMYRLYGIEPTQFSNAYEAWESSLSTETKAKATAEISAAVRGERDFDTTFQVVHPSGKIQNLRTRAIVIKDKEGTPIEMHGINIDRSREAEIEHAIEIERAKTIQSAKLASIGEMSAGIAHEINNPLTIISGNVDLLAKIKDDPLKFEAKIGVLKKSVERIQKQVAGLQKFSHSSQDSKLGSISLTKMINESVSFLEVKSKLNNTPVTIEIESECILLCDELAIEQVFVNLIGNAIDAVKKNPVRWVKITVHENENHVICRVIDSGDGIPEKIRVKLFEPFFTSKPVGEGTGLGLSIIKRTLDQHKATIQVLGDHPNTCFEIQFIKEKKT